MFEYYDFHTHSPQSPEGVTRMLCTVPGASASPPFSSGIHPWDTAAPGVEEHLLWLEQHIGELAAVGEIGLDRLRGASLERQAELFRRQLQLAETHNLPVILHNVRCTPEILSMLRRPERALWHRAPVGRNNLARIIDSGGTVSFTAENLRHLDPAPVPLSRLGLETDDSGEDIRETYRIAAALWRVTPEELAAQLAANFRKLFYR